jgi:hypothetical protein
LCVAGKQFGGMVVVYVFSGNDVWRVSDRSFFYCLLFGSRISNSAVVRNEK